MGIINKKIICAICVILSSSAMAESSDLEICMKEAHNQLNEMKECQIDELKLQEKRVNKNFKTLLSHVDGDERKLLQSHQNRWNTQQKKMCGVNAEKVKNLSMVQIQCVVKVVTTRAEMLEIQLRNKNLL